MWLTPSAAATLTKLTFGRPTAMPASAIRSRVMVRGRPRAAGGVSGAWSLRVMGGNRGLPRQSLNGEFTSLAELV